jgi:hypothetical protein
MGHCTKSLRSSPLRGRKSREAGGDGEDSDSAVATIKSRIVGVIKNSRIICGPSHTANQIYPAHCYSFFRDNKWLAEPARVRIFRQEATQLGCT